MATRRIMVGDQEVQIPDFNFKIEQKLDSLKKTSFNDPGLFDSLAFVYKKEYQNYYFLQL